MVVERSDVYLAFQHPIFQRVFREIKDRWEIKALPVTKDRWEIKALPVTKDR
jgi:hypothetical protein